MRSFILIAATIIAMMATCVSPMPVASENNQEEKVGTLEEETNKISKACDVDFVAIKADASIVTMEKIFDKFDPKFVAENYERLFRNHIRFCQTMFNSTEVAPGDKHLASIKASLKH